MRCFCACNFTVDKTAELLYIHKNTLRYRIHRIEEILGISFSSMAQIANIITCIESEKILHIL
ncbi:MAG: helix-turn-helix domain-containing protein [Clostridia bacterium]